ncbi:MAG: hypothetical protein QXW86_01095, partial [Saccharolobus sp.]
MAFGRLSYYDVFLASLQDLSVERRYFIISIPSFLPYIYRKYYGNLHISANTLWWFSRGRIGWIENILHSLPSSLDVDSLLHFDQSSLSKSSMIRGVPIIYLEELRNLDSRYCSNNIECKSSIRYLILRLEPEKFDKLPDLVKKSIDKSLGKMISACKKPIDIKDLVNDFISDIFTVL